MSHLTPVGVQYRDKALLLEALSTMGLSPQVGQFTLTNNHWKSDKSVWEVQIIVPASSIHNCRVDIGFRLENEAYSLVCDSYELASWRGKVGNDLHMSFTEELAVRYGIAAVKRSHPGIQEPVIERVGNELKVTANIAAKMAVRA